MLKDIVTKSRSYRRFFEEEAVAEATLRELVELARLSPTGSNLQALKFVLSCTKDMNALIFPNLAWAHYLTEWSGPNEGERPAAYIIILLDKEIKAEAGIDHGIAAQSILLGAVEKGLGGCMIANIKRAPLMKTLNMPERFHVLLVLALGKQKETVVIEPVKPSGDIKYYRDIDGVHHVPKRSLDNLILKV
jgi:nitroreductase